MAYLDEFHRVVGDTILECQRIEHDIKLIYAGMLKGNFDRNIKIVENKSLGTVLALLETLDNSDQKPYFHQEDYRLLYDIKRYPQLACAQVVYGICLFEGSSMGRHIPTKQTKTA